MHKLTLKEIYQKPEDFSGQEVVLQGWLRNNRDQKSFGFLTLKKHQVIIFYYFLYYIWHSLCFQLSLF